MNLLLEKFEKLYDKYQNKREKFKRVIDRLRDRGESSLASKGESLLSDADRLCADLKIAFSGPNASSIKQQPQVKSLKKILKQLNEMTKPVWRQWIEAIVVALLLAVVLRNFVFGLYHVPTGSAEPNILVGDRIWGNKMAYYVSDIKRGDLVIFDNPEFKYDRESSFGYYWQRYVGFPIPVLGLGGGPENWVKRVIGLPGDLVEGRIENGKTVVYRNRKKLKEEYVNNLPLITLRKSVGFLPIDSIGPLSLPTFLRRMTKEVHYTYDPSQPYNKQPYYYIEDHEVVRNPLNDKPILIEAYTPCYDQRLFFGNQSRDEYAFIVPENHYWVMGDSRKNSRDSRWWQFLPKDLVHGRASFVIYSIDSEEAFWLFDLIKHPLDFWTKHVRWNRFFKGLNGWSGKTE